MSSFLKIAILLFIVGSSQIAQGQQSEGWGGDARQILADSSRVWNRPTATSYDLDRLIWIRTDTVDVREIRDDIVYYVEEGHNVFDARTGEPRPKKGMLRERDGYQWVVLETNDSVTYWRYRGEAMSRFVDDAGATAVQALWSEGMSSLTTLSYGAEGEVIRARSTHIDTEPADLLDFIPFSYWAASATALHADSEDKLEVQEENGLRTLWRESDIGHDSTQFQQVGEGRSELMIRNTEIEYDDETHSFRYVGLQRFEGLALPEEIEIDHRMQEGKRLEEVRITNIKMQHIDESEFTEIKERFNASVRG